MIPANNPNLSSWIDVSGDSDFPIQNLPFGIVSVEGKPRVATAIGEYVIDLLSLARLGYFRGQDDLDLDTLDRSTLNDFISQGKAKTNAIRERLSRIFQADNDELRDNEEAKEKVLIPMSKAVMLMPVAVGDYTDFYSSRDHATNVGKMFRDPENALLPNWLHLPVGYHGRASSIVVSGTPIYRPKGQQMPQGASQPVFGASKLLDFELEVGFVVGKETRLGDSISIDEAENHIFGLVLFNDWSARDIQKWEYVPLGPFLGKNFGSSISPWIVTLEALEPFRSKSPEQNEPRPLPYLQFEGDKNYDINLFVDIETPEGVSKTVSESNFKYMYWNMCQQLTHHTVNGCNVNVGDMCASGTISGPEKGSYGSMLEISWRGTEPVDMPDGTQRKFINDGDSVIMRGFGKKDGVRIGFGEVRTKVLPARE